jgi:acetyl esterase/lipase
VTSCASDSLGVIAGAVRDLGYRFDEGVLEATRAIYAPYLRGQHRDAESIRLDVAYSTHERQVLDIYGKDLPGPAVLFIHGGGFVAGSKRVDDLFYANVGHAFAAAGIQAVLANYRLAPAATWPAAIDDIAAAVEWLHGNLGLGEAGRPLVLVGQSAGATHAAGYLFDPRTAGRAARHLAGCAVLSGVYRMDASRSPGALAYFGEDTEVAAVRSPISQIGATAVPVLVTVSEFDPPAIAWHSFELAQLLTLANDRSPHFRGFAGHNHVSTMHSLGSPQVDVLRVLCDFVRRCAAARPYLDG